MPRISRLILTYAFFLAAVFYVSAQADDWLVQANKSMRASDASLHSLVGEGEYEVTQNKEGMTNPLVKASARVQVYFDEGKYHIHIKYSQPWRDAQQKLGVHLKLEAVQAGNPKFLQEDIDSNWDEFYVIYDGTMAYEIAIANQSDIPSRTAFIHSDLATALGRHGVGLSTIDPARMWRNKFEVDNLMKWISEGRFSIEEQVKNANGSQTQKYLRNVPTGQRIEHDMLPTFGYRISEFRAFTDEWPDPVNRQTVQWKQFAEEWFVTKFTYERPSFSADKSTFEYLRFEPNKSVDSRQFTLDGIDVPNGFEFVDMRPGKAMQSLYKFRNSLTPIMPHAVILGYLQPNQNPLISGLYLESAHTDVFSNHLAKRAELGLELISVICALTDEQKQKLNDVFTFQNSILIGGVKSLADEINAGRIVQDPQSLEYTKRIAELLRRTRRPYLASDQIGGKVLNSQLDENQKRRLQEFILSNFIDTITPYLDLKQVERNSLIELLREGAKTEAQYVFDPQIYFDLLGKADQIQMFNLLGKERMGFFLVARGNFSEFITTTTPITIKSGIARREATIELERRNIKP